jgi:hypothetical protein
MIQEFQISRDLPLEMANIFYLGCGVESIFHTN